MTKKQQEDFAKLELAYLDQVQQQNPDGQIRQMEVIFFWLKKQIGDSIAPFILEEAESKLHMAKIFGEITAAQKGEFTFLQMAMIGAAYRAEPDKLAIREIELKMREWIDKQITAAVNGVIKPKMKIIRDNGREGRG